MKGDLRYGTHLQTPGRVGGPKNAQEPLSRTDLCKKKRTPPLLSCARSTPRIVSRGFPSLTVVMVSRIQVESDGWIGCKLA